MDERHLTNVENEMRRGEERYGKFASGHEFMAVLQEEVTELWEDIRLTGYPSYHELVQVAAVALRAIHQYGGDDPDRFERERSDLFKNGKTAERTDA